MVRPSARMTGIHKHDGFTMVEILVVLSILGVLTAILLPAVQASRAVSRRAECGFNCKQIMLAFHQHVDVHREFPGPVKEMQYWDVRILPFLEQQQPVVEKSGKVTFSPECVAVYRCPSDPFAAPNLQDKSYCPGNGHGHHARNGFYCTATGAAIRPSDVTDGLSATVAISERLATPSQLGIPLTDEVSWRHRVIRKTSTFIRAYDAFADECESHSQNPRASIFVEATFNHIQTPNRHSCTNGNRNENTSRDYMAVAPSSLHPGGVNVGMGDGSVRFVSDSIYRSVWRAIGTRNGAETISSDF